ncbi:hypothetical protein SETIT_5G137100v2 [Setaria italica]|uniref:Uncharacterized protein n=1 Tax=Setaria italica TaxID=4555 RepID=A0A368R4K8_SETIT|nr:hypothetical protein SETIT_5G137100v2 [Setaria italica]
MGCKPSYEAEIIRTLNNDVTIRVTVALKVANTTQFTCLLVELFTGRGKCQLQWMEKVYNHGYIYNHLTKTQFANTCNM